MSPSSKSFEVARQAASIMGYESGLWEYVNSMRVRSLAVEVVHEVASFLPPFLVPRYVSSSALGWWCIVSVTCIAT